MSKGDLFQRFVGADGESRNAMVAVMITLTIKAASAFSIFAFTWLVARDFGATGSGIFAIATTIMAIACVLGSLGLDIAATRAVSSFAVHDDWARARAHVGTAVWLTIIVGGGLAGGIFLAGNQMAAPFGGDTALGHTISILGLASLPLMLARLFAASLRGARRFLSGNFVDPFLAPAAMTLLLLALQLTSVPMAASTYLASTTIAAIAGFALWRRALAGRHVEHAPLRFSESLANSLPIFGTLVGGFATPWIVVLAVGYFGTIEEAGVYRVAMQFSLLLGFILQAAESGLAPHFAALKARGALHLIGPAARRMSIILVIFGVLPGVFILVFAEPILGLFGAEFIRGALSLRILIGSQIILSLLGPVGQLMIMSGLDRYSLLNSLAGSVLVAILAILLIPRYGVVGAAASAGVTSVVRAVMATIIVWRKRGIFLPTGKVRPRV
jgi:O-antigen/teichoic acid export membrane protein